MRSFIKIVISLLFAITATASGFSQISRVVEKDFDTDFRKVSSGLGASNYTIATEYNFYNDYTTQQPYKTMPGYYSKKDNDYKSLALGVLTIQKANHKLFVDTLSKTLVVADADEPANTKSMGIDTGLLKAYCNKLEKRDSSEENRTYRLYFKRPIDNVASVEIVFNLKAGHIKKLVMYHATSVDLTGSGNKNAGRPRTEVVFKKPEYNRTKDTDFEISHYVIIQKDNISVKEGYSHYKFYNHLLKK